MDRPARPRRAFSGALVLALLLTPAAVRAQGIVLSGVGPVNRSMGGAAVAAPIDGDGALYWNPASISAIPGAELELGIELLYPSTRVSSTFQQGAFGPGTPSATLSGSDRGDNGFFPLPEGSLVYSPEGSRWTFGMGLFTVGGFSVNYPASLTNPILTPQAPHGVGLGALYTDFDVIQFVPTASFTLTDHLSVGASPTINMAKLTASPAFFAAPDDANGDGFPTYPSAVGGRYNWGLGFQAGAFYTTDAGWNFGASLKSPQWFEPLRFNSADELGRPRTLQFDIDYPLIASLGASYTALPDWVIDADVHFVDYHNTNGFNRSGFDASGAAAGLGWRSIFTCNVGVQYQATDDLALRMGYTYGMNPIPDSEASANVQAPAVNEHSVYCGLSYQIRKGLAASVAYTHAFQNSIEGPLVTPAGPVPGTSVQSTASIDTAIFGATLKY